MGPAPLMKMMGAAALLISSCGSSAASRSTYPARQVSPRAERVSSGAPELASAAERLRALADRARRSGDQGLARELDQLSDLTYVSASELLARLEAAEQRVRAAEGRAASPEVRPAAPPLPQPLPEGAAAQTESEATPPRRSIARPGRSRSGREADLGRGADTDRDTETQLRARLARIAERLATVPATATNRVTLDSIQAKLIEADRALSGGNIADASRHAAEAERLLAGLQTSAQAGER